MKQQRLWVFLIAALVACAPAFLMADVKIQQKTQMKFEGMMGRVMGMFGGKTMKEGVIETVAVKGNRKATLGQESGEIIDLDEEVVYRLDMRRKTYRTVTFAALRRELEEAQAKVVEAMKGEKPGAQAQPADQSLMQIDFDLKESGQKRQINGYDCREVIMTVTMHEKGKPIEQSGGTVMTANIWLAPEIPYLEEIQEFDRRYAEKLRSPLALSAADAQQMAAAMAVYPGMQEMMAKLQAEKVNMSGTEILTVLTMASVKSAQQMQQEEREAEKETPATTGGIGGLLGRRLLKKKAEQPAEAGQAPNRTTILTIQHELVSAAPSAAAADVALPAGFKQAK